jgi:hypothetical protein
LKVTGKNFAVVATRKGVVRSRSRGAGHINGAMFEDARQFGSVQCLVLVREVWNTAIGRLLDSRHIQGTLLSRSQVRGVHYRLVEVPRKIPGGDAGRESEGYRSRKEVHLERLSRKMVVAELGEMWKLGVLHIACGSPDEARSPFRAHRRKHVLQVPAHVVQGLSRWRLIRSEASGAACRGRRMIPVRKSDSGPAGRLHIQRRVGDGHLGSLGRYRYSYCCVLVPQSMLKSVDNVRPVW